jgi:predicted Zn finger-like uncharacterized protein
VKFLCDRCKTRYSIGDDRVRGKILKIRCKNCANVITVREGMTDEGAADVAAPQRGRPTTGAPNPAHTSVADGGSALGAAFAAQLTKPPAALEEEWYVSIDGEQQGPFNLTAAQKWIGTQPHDADLYCWSEGFDDWLPVDKVSHFRNLRKKPMAPTPPPLPRVASVRTEETPKPLFAATMASLERTSASDPKISMPSMAASPAAAPAKISTPVGGVKANGMTAAAAAPAIPSVAKGTGTSRTPAPGVVATPAANGTSQPNGGKGANGGNGKMSAGAKALAAAFDASDDIGDSMTAIEAPSFNDEVATRAEPVAAKRAQEPAMPARSPAASSPDLDDDNLDIGEVSRVVKLADIARSAPSGAAAPRRSNPQIGNRTGSVQRISASNLQPIAPGGMPMQPDMAGMPVGEAPAPGESVLAGPIAEQSHRRGMIMLIAFAAVLLLGVAGAVVLLVASGDDGESLGLGNTTVVNTQRPDEIVRHTQDPTGTGSAGTVIKTPTKHSCPPFCGPSFQQPYKNPIVETPGDPNLKKLDASEVEDYATKQNGITQRCFMRAQKGVDGILVGEVKKIFVTLSIDKDGNIADAQLSEHSADALGRCLLPAIKRWKFRPSPGGTYRFALAFANG